MRKKLRAGPRLWRAAIRLNRLGRKEIQKRSKDREEKEIEKETEWQTGEIES